jgi:hypothetical protein
MRWIYAWAVHGPSIYHSVAKPKLSDQLAMVEDQLLQEQTKSPHQQDFSLQAQLTDQHHQLLAKDKEFHLQCEKGHFMATATLHSSISRLSKEPGRTGSPTFRTLTAPIQPLMTSFYLH